jgi:hypothetical protein
MVFGSRYSHLAALDCTDGVMGRNHHAQLLAAKDRTAGQVLSRTRLFSLLSSDPQRIEQRNDRVDLVLH